MLGRVFGALQSLAMAGIPVGNALTGFAVEGMGVTVTIMAMAVVYSAVTLGMFLRPALRQMDFQHPDDRTDSAPPPRPTPEFCTMGLPTLGVPNLAMFR
jgi:hypothetical protein